jgi:hypothetical protein
MAAEKVESLQVVLFHFLACGHISAFLLLQDLFPGITVTLVSTWRLLASILLLATRLSSASTLSHLRLPTKAVQA